MTPQQFIAKWQRVTFSERAACQQHFLDLCDVLGQPKPAEADPDGAWYTFEKGVTKTDGGSGWADVWMKNHFGWEYKGKHKNLKAAYDQLLLYREALENPPLLVVCDMDRFEVHTNFTGTQKRVYPFSLEQLAEPANLDVLRKLFSEPEALKPGLTTESITNQAAEHFGQVADKLRMRSIAPDDAAHFLMKIMFCMFAEDTGLLQNKLFSRVLENGRHEPENLRELMRGLFQAMTKGGLFGADKILHFNGGLFADADVIELKRDEIEELVRANQYDWASVAPHIFGTLFERILDPAKRSQIGAHYTSKEDILTLLEPVVMAPLRKEWEAVRAECEAQWEKIKAAGAKNKGKSPRAAAPSKAMQKFERTLIEFNSRLAEVKILDPACGSGNFLYVAINLLLDLEKQVIAYAATRGVSLLPQVRPTQLAGLEINPYAQQLAQVVIWIGYLQWMLQNGFRPAMDPVLEPIETIRHMDAILDLSDPDHPKEPEWPEADFIVGNPPFLGGKMLRSNLSDEYVDSMFALWEDRVPREADLCCYWFEKARTQIKRKLCNRAGLLATQGIRGGANRRVLQRIKESGDIFFAESDRAWTLEGAAVHVSMIAFDDSSDTNRQLDGKPASSINSNLTSNVDVTRARRLRQDIDTCFMADTKGGAFDIAEPVAIEMLQAPNPHGQPNSDVIVPWVNGLDVTRRHRGMWIIDFGENSSLNQVALYEAPFQYLDEHVKPQRARSRTTAPNWWRHERPRPDMRNAIVRLPRFLTTAGLAKHRIFAWMVKPTLPDHQLYVFSRDDDYFFGVVHSRLHEAWGLRLGTRLETRPRYTPTSCFETFPFPLPTAEQERAIAEEARELNELRENWLNPPEWTRTEYLEFPGSVDGPWARYIDTAPPGATGSLRATGSLPASADLSQTRADKQPVAPTPGGNAERTLAGKQPVPPTIGLVRYPRLVPRDEECAKKLKKRTLTNLYNERPAWLDLAHHKLDAAVFAAYGWEPSLSDEQLLEKLLALNLERAK